MVDDTQRRALANQTARRGPKGEDTQRELALSLERARQEVCAAALLSRHGHAAEGLRMSLRALDSAFRASQLKSGHNEPARALRTLGIAPEQTALDVLCRARTLDVAALDQDVTQADLALGTQARAVASELLRASGGEKLPRTRLSAWIAWLMRFARPMPALPR